MPPSESYQHPQHHLRHVNPAQNARAQHQPPPPPPPPGVPGTPNVAAPSGTTGNHFIDAMQHSSNSADILLSIKCPSLDTDSTSMRFRPDTTIAQVKQIIHQSWPGQPRPEGMRCIRAGRILEDCETVGDFVSEAERNEPVSIHLVIRPGAWADPQNRPTPSRRSSYLLLNQAPASPIASASTSASRPPSSAATSPYFSSIHPSSLFRPSPSSRSTSASPSRFRPHRSGSADDRPDRHRGPRSGSPSLPSTPRAAQGDEDDDFDDSAFSQEAMDAYHKFGQILAATAPSNFPLLKQAVTLAYEAYLDDYERAYQVVSHKQKGKTISVQFPETRPPILDALEKDYFGWDPVQRPPPQDANVAPNSVLYFHRQVQHQGLPHLLRLAAAPSDQEYSKILAELLRRMRTLHVILRKIDSLTMLDNVIRHSRAQREAGGAPNNQAAPGDRATTPVAAAPTLPPRQLSSVQRAVRVARETFSELTWAEVVQVSLPLLFLSLKMGFVIFLFTRGASPLKRYAMMLAAFAYVCFEGWTMIRRRILARRQARAPPAPPAGRNVPHAQAAAAATAAAAAAAGAEGQTHAPNTNDSDAPLRAPRRYTAGASAFQQLLERIAYVGMDSEDEQLGLLPSTPGAGATTSVRRGRFFHLVLVPTVLFFASMVPDIEMRRRAAIEERERVVSKANEERRQDQASAVRDEYSQRILRRRRAGAAADFDPADIPRDNDEGGADFELF